MMTKAENVKLAGLLVLSVVALYFIATWVGHHHGNEMARKEYPHVVAVAGTPETWSKDEQRVMAHVLIRCHTENQSGDSSAIKACWRKHAADAGTDGTQILNVLLTKASKI